MSVSQRNETHQLPPRLSLGSMDLPDEPGRAEAPAANLFDQNRPNSPVSGSHPNTTSLNEAIDILRMIVLNEHYTPDILPFQHDAIDAMRELVDTQTTRVDDEDDDETLDQLSFESQLKRMELDRINYQLRHYYRLRLQKVQNFVLHIFSPDGPYDRLSEPEKRFAVGYSDLSEDHFKRAFLSLLPQRIQTMDSDGNVKPVTTPNLDKFVFCRVRNTVGSYVIGEQATDDALDLSKGDILCIRYKSIRQLLANEDVQLI